MSWIENYSKHLVTRDTLYNRSLAMNKINVTNMIENFDSLWNNFTNFTDEIASLQLYPFTIETIPVEDETKTSYLETSKGWAQGVRAFEIDYKCSYMNFGQEYIEPKYNNFADYKGYTQIKAFIPFVGYVDLDTNECMGKWLQFRLLVDFYSGKGIFIVGVTDTELDFNSFNDRNHPTETEDADIRVISTFECDIGVNIPLGKSNIGDIKRNLLLGAVKTAAGIATGISAISMPPASTVTTSVVEPTVKTYDVQGRSTAKGSRLKTIKAGTVTTEGGSKTTTSVHHTPVNYSKPASDVLSSSIDSLSNATIHSNTDRVNDPGLMWNISNKVRIIIYRPKFVTLDSNYGSLYGYPLGDTYELGDLSGYTEINAIHIEGEGFETITNKEVALLEEVFANGIIL